MPASRHTYTLHHIHGEPAERETRSGPGFTSTPRPVAAHGPAERDKYTADQHCGSADSAEVPQSVTMDREQLTTEGENNSTPGSDVVDGGTCSEQTDSGCTITYQDVVYTVQMRHKCCSTVPKEIIKGVSGYFKPGMNAIMGATGSGKTSLLDIMAVRKNPSGLDGTILVDGNDQPKNFKCMTGYVVQDDVVMGTLSVRENFLFSANLRLPSSVTKAEKESRVDAVINELGLPHVANSKVGNEFIRGISGGERKRTNIGMELITTPKVLFLDEPTTGLDASTANAVMYMLYRMARKGRTIIFSIHQPRYSIFKLFDHLALLSQGFMVYHGPAQEALEYFSTIGFECEAHNNPADFFLDIINGDSTAVQISKIREGPSVVNAAFEAGMDDGVETSVVLPLSPNDDNELAIQLNGKFKESQWYKNTMSDVNEVVEDYRNTRLDSNPVQVQAGDYAVSFFTQLRYVAKRTILNITRNPQTSVLQIFVMVIFGLLVGAIYFQMKTDLTGLQNRVGAFFFIVMNQVFGNLSAVELFIKERKIFIHENSNGFYRVSAYFLAKLFCDIIPMRIVPNTVFSVIVYFMIGLQVDPGKFFTFLLIVCCVSLAASGLGFFFSATVRVFAIANLCIALCYVFMMVFSGLLVNLNSVLDWLAWIKWMSIFRYGMNALNINELKGLEFCGLRPNATGYPIMVCEEGIKYLQEQNIPYEEPLDLWVNIIALSSMAAIFLILTYIQLRRVNKYS